tara:strand:+ start:878 stop:1687 length:810 start_codon:yes stop_codon:yes gene_type:complete
MILKLKRWQGRLGNRIIQVRNVIHVALYYNYNIIIPPCEFFNKEKIIINKNIKQSDENILYDHEGDNFFHERSITQFSQECFTQNYTKMRSILIDLFIYDYKKIQRMRRNDLLIHIRSGDLFSSDARSNSCVRKYQPPPISYYNQIIKEKKGDDRYKHIYIVSEDDKNPCIKELLKMYPKIRFKINNLHHDIKLILSAKNVVSSIGSFLPSILFFTKNTENVFYPSYDNSFLRICPQEIKKNKIQLIHYQKKLKLWKNTSRQRNLLINL